MAMKGQFGGIWKEAVVLCRVLRYCHILLEEMRNTAETLNQDSRFRGRYSDRLLPNVTAVLTSSILVLNFIRLLNCSKFLAA